MMGRSNFAGGVFLIGLLLFPPVGLAGEYYSWIDADGTMVMTDNPSRIPSAQGRSPVQIHRFADVEPSEPAQTEGERVLFGQDPEPTPGPQTARTEPIDPSDLDLPSILLDEPGGTMRVQYVWVPLLSPVFVGSNSLNGFWWHRGTSSPVEAFKNYLAGHHRQQGGTLQRVQTPHWPRQQWVDPVTPSGNPVYDQVVREQRALLDAHAMRLGATMQLGPTMSGGIRGPSAGGRSSGGGLSSTGSGPRAGGARSGSRGGGGSHRGAGR